MFFRQLLIDQTGCASYVLGCKTHRKFAVVDPHIDLIDKYLLLAAEQGAQIVAAFETHVQADHISGLPDLVARTGSSAYLPEGAGVTFEHHPLRAGAVVRLGNTELRAVATPGHTLAHHCYLVTDRTRSAEPWLVLTGDALLIGDVGRPDLHTSHEHPAEAMARLLFQSVMQELLTLPDDLVLYPAHYSGSACGRGLSANPVSTLGFERRYNPALQFDSADGFISALLRGLPDPPPEQAEIVALNRSGLRIATA